MQRRPCANYSCNNFRTNLSYMATVHQRHEQTDWRTNGQLTVAILCVHCAVKKQYWSVLKGEICNLHFNWNTRYKLCCYEALVLSWTVSEILQVFCWEQRPHPYSTRILGVFLLDKIADVVAPRREDPMLIICVITFELIRLTWHGTSMSQTDGWTTYCSNTGTVR